MAPSFSSTRILATRSAAAAAMLMATYSMAPTTAQAREPIAPACRQAGDELAQLKCSTALSKKATAEQNVRTQRANARVAAADAQIAASDRNIADANKRSAAADKEIAEAKKLTEASVTSKACYDAVLDAVNTAKKIAPLTPEQKSAFKARAAGCEKS